MSAIGAMSGAANRRGAAVPAAIGPVGGQAAAGTRIAQERPPARAGAGYSEHPRSRDAGVEAARAALAQAGVDRCDLVLLFTTSKHDPAALLEGVRSVVGPRPQLIGGYAAGIITNDRLGYEGHQVGVAVLASPALRVDTFVAQPLSGGERAAGQALGRQIAAATFDGEPHLLLMYDSVKAFTPVGASFNYATPLLAGLSETIGRWPPMAGVGMIGDLNFHPTHQFLGDQVLEQAAMALVLSGGIHMDTIVMHGCRPSSGYHTITKTDGPTVLEIDGRPALDVIGDLLGPDSDVPWERYPLFITLGVNRGDKFGPFDEAQYASRVCAAVDRERKGLVMWEPDLVSGMEVQLMRRSIGFEYVGERAAQLLARLAGRRPFFAFYIDCAGRAAAYCGSEGEEGAEVQRVIGSRMPLLGMYSGVEIARVGGVIQPLDWTGVLCVFSEAP